MGVDSNSTSQNEFGLCYMHHVQKLFDDERRGKPIQAPPRVVEFARHFYGEVKRCIKISRPSRRRDRLNNEAERFRRLIDWRAEFPELADACFRALVAQAGEVKRGYAGNPNCYLGATQNRERGYVNRAYEELDDLARSHSRHDWMVELRLPGDKNRPSRGRALVAKYAMRLADADGVKLNESELSKQIREYVKTAPPPLFNALCLLRPRKRQQQECRRIKAAGT